MKKSSKRQSGKDLNSTLNKDQRRLLYRGLYKNYGQRQFMSYETHPEHMVAHLKHKLADNPEYGAELLIIGYSVEGEKSSSAKYLEQLHKKYWKRFCIKYLIPRVKRLGGRFPTMNKTLAIKEFIARGFKHEEDVLLDLKNRYCIKCNIAPLWWPKDFELHQEAIEVMGKMGIAGLTGTTTPKTK